MRPDTRIPKGAKGAWYGRVSTRKQESDMQRDSVYTVAEKYGWTIVKHYLDEGVSASSVPWEKRAQLCKLLDDIKQKKYDFVIVYKNDRLARNPAEHEELRKIFRRFEVPVVLSSTEELYDKDELIVRAVKDGLTKMEAEFIRQRTRHVAETRTKDGKRNGAKLPYGYRYNPDKDMEEIVESEADVVRDIFEMYKTGEGFQSIADWLNEQGHKTANRNHWTKEAVKVLILNPFYAGYVTCHRYKSGTVVRDREAWIMKEYRESQLAIIDPDEWEYCFSGYEAKRNAQVDPKRFKTPFLVRDILYCGPCQQPFRCKNQTSKSKNKQKVYKSLIYYCPFCKKKRKADDIHQAIQEHIQPFMFQQEQRRLQHHLQDSFSKEAEQLEQEVERLEEEMKDCEGRVEKVVPAIKEAYDEARQNQNSNFEFVNVLIRYHISLKENMEQLKKNIEQKQKRSCYIKTVKMDTGERIEILPSLFESPQEHRTKIRMLFLQLFQKIELDEKDLAHYELRIDMNIQSHIL